MTGVKGGEVPIIKTEDLVKREGSSPGLEARILVDAEQGSESLRIGELTIAPNTRVPRHIHTNTEEAMIVLEGTLDALVGSERMTIGPGQTVLAPAGTTHGFVNRYDQPARLLFVFPTHLVERVLSSATGTTSGFLSEGGLTGFASPEERPLDRG
jgi:quercetin dioxygenase-like cupin family protein